MRLAKGIKLELIKPGGPPYPEVTKGSDHYVIAQPGQPFQVQASAEAALLQPGQLILAYLKMDGKCVGYANLLTSGQPTGIFRGFLQTVKGRQHYAQFKFGDAQAADRPTAGNSDAAATAETGTVQCIFHRAILDGFCTKARVPDTFASGQGGLKEGIRPYRSGCQACSTCWQCSQVLLGN